MPAYFAEKTLKNTYLELPKIYKEVMLCDDGSLDQTYDLSNQLGITTVKHKHNQGYGKNQKTLYDLARKRKPDYLIMVHPDNQYDTKCLTKMIKILKDNDEVAMILGSRIKTALKNGMPLWKYMGNKLLTTMQNFVYQTSLSEFHSGLRAYKAEIFNKIPYHQFSDDFVFDSEIIAWLVSNNHGIREVETQCHYSDIASSINLKRSIRYGVLTLITLLRYSRGYYKTLKK